MHTSLFCFCSGVSLPLPRPPRDLPLVAFTCVIPKRLRLCTRCPRTHQPNGLSVWIDESGWGGILVEELELPWVAGTFVADIFVADVPKYSDF